MFSVCLYVVFDWTMNIVFVVVFDNEKAGIFLNKIEFFWVVVVFGF